MATNYKAILNSIILFAALFGVWVVLSGYFTPFLLFCGLASAAISVYIAYRMDVIDRHHFTLPLYASFRMIGYSLWLIREILYSSISTAQIIWQLSPSISPVMGPVRATQKNDVGLTLFANSITLTPGTVSILVEKNKILIHALREEGFEEFGEGDMDARVTRITG